jgi:hypothetical protein
MAEEGWRRLFPNMRQSIIDMTMGLGIAALILIVLVVGTWLVG